MRKTLKVTPSFLFKLMKHCSKLETNADLIQSFESLATLDSPLLTGDDFDQLEQAADDSTPEHLQELKDALEGAVSDDEKEDE